MPAISRLASTGRGDNGWRRENASSLWVSCAARWPPIRALRSGRSSAASAHLRSAMSRLPMMTVSRLLKSWAMPPVSCPIASIFCDWRSVSSAAARRAASRWSVFGAHQRQPGERDEEGGRRQAEEQMAAQKVEPLLSDLVDPDAGAHIEREPVELANGEPAVRAVDLGHRRIVTAVRIARDALHEAAAGIELDVQRHRAGIAGEDDAVGPHHRVAAALHARQALVEIMEIARSNRNHDDAGESIRRDRAAFGSPRKIAHFPRGARECVRYKCRRLRRDGRENNRGPTGSRFGGRGLSNEVARGRPSRSMIQISFTAESASAIFLSWRCSSCELRICSSD